MFFLANVCNNYAFDFNIPMPLHMIFRAVSTNHLVIEVTFLIWSCNVVHLFFQGSLIANMIMGIIILNKKYAFSKYLSVFMISTGIAICTIVSGKEIKSLQQKSVEQVPTTPWDDFFWWILGISLLTIALFVSARMGIYQEVLYSRYGKNAREALYYTVNPASLQSISSITNFASLINDLCNIFSALVTAAVFPDASIQHQRSLEVCACVRTTETASRRYTNADAACVPDRQRSDAVSFPCTWF